MDMQASITPESTANTPMVKSRKKQRAVLFSLLGLAVAGCRRRRLRVLEARRFPLREHRRCLHRCRGGRRSPPRPKDR